MISRKEFRGARYLILGTQSGEFTGTRQHISKRGSPYLRRTLWLAANRAAFCDSIPSDCYQSLKSRGKHHLTAVGAIARKMCNIIFTILRENRPCEAAPPKKQGLKGDA
ncbi:transposase [Beduinella massiliensis]|uniref:transposase n=1 Tax=Beduinella massiliensis TaxID=1852363 RepID=UPI000C85135F